MGAILLIIIVLVVVYFMNERRKNAAKLEAECQEIRRKNTETPEDQKVQAAYVVYRDDHSEANRKRYLDAVDEDQKHWREDFLIALRYDAGLDGFPFDRKEAGKWYGKALKKAKAFGNQTYVEDLNRFIRFYNRPYGNFKSGADPRMEQTRRIETACLMCARDSGIIRGNLRSGAEGTLVRYGEFIEMVKKMKGHSDMAIQVLEDYAFMSKISLNDPNEYQLRKQRYDAFRMPDVEKQFEPGVDFEFFLFGMMLLEDRNPYAGGLRETVENVGSSVEQICVKAFSRAFGAGSTEALYMELEQGEAYKRVYKWDEDDRERNAMDHFFEYTGRMGWTEDAKLIAREFFPDTDEAFWIH